MEAAIPAYFHPAADPEGWEWLRRSSVPWAVINVHNGPGTEGDPYYTPLIKTWDGPRLCGYVNVDYGHRDHDEILADAAAWQEFHAVSALMLDCFPVDGELAAGVRLIEKLRGWGHDFIVANAGRNAPAELLRSADVTCVVELDWNTYQQQKLAAEAGDTWHLIHSVPVSEMPDARDLMVRNGATYGWATPATLPHPYGWHESLVMNL